VEAVEAIVSTPAAAKTLAPGHGADVVWEELVAARVEAVLTVFVPCSWRQRSSPLSAPADSPILVIGAMVVGQVRALAALCVAIVRRRSSRGGRRGDTERSFLIVAAAALVDGGVPADRARGGELGDRELTFISHPDGTAASRRALAGIVGMLSPRRTGALVGILVQSRHQLPAAWCRRGVSGVERGQQRPRQPQRGRWSWPSRPWRSGRVTTRRRYAPVGEWPA
jgi:hypothetical protein